MVLFTCDNLSLICAFQFFIAFFRGGFPNPFLFILVLGFCLVFLEFCQDVFCYACFVVKMTI